MRQPLRLLSHRCLSRFLFPSHGLKTVNGMLFLSKKNTSFSDRNVTVCYEILRSDGLSGKDADKIFNVVFSDAYLRISLPRTPNTITNRITPKIALKELC